ncbi:MAG: DNA-processing protein DprA [Candidatus Shapirobacteria bacterium]|nr:DNA-processing protein DprA [Candidatus Shapirobacteria bacterium]
MKTWNKYKINQITKADFPEQLKKIKNCPERLFYRGEWDNKIFDKSLAIVGSRRITRYGQAVVEKFMPDLVADKITVISGFMYGIDSEAHRKCLELGGITVAVLGGGLDILTPSENDDLYTKILENGGLVISEYEADFKPTLWSFPQRNRIVSGLSTKGILVVEAGMKSGSLITARIGLEQKKMIYAVPGPINSLSSMGTNWLIKEKWAEILTDIESITKRKSVMVQEQLWDDNLPPLQKKIYNLLKTEPMSVDEICRKTGIRVTEINLAVTMMSLNNLVAEFNGKIGLTNV